MVFVWYLPAVCIDLYYPKSYNLLYFIDSIYIKFLYHAALILQNLSDVAMLHLYPIAFKDGAIDAYSVVEWIKYN